VPGASNEASNYISVKALKCARGAMGVDKKKEGICEMYKKQKSESVEEGRAGNGLMSHLDSRWQNLCWELT
jgi:hypothetical protein